ncbi:MAG: hypothetical protein CMF46_02210 [Legionellales bacterium]|nr:hypothetical protein [Legionellales bacterium]|tara:strand:- start:43 stop:453 length:411 start_codon:yes stop_codon:yes gene_type:complete
MITEIVELSTILSHICLYYLSAVAVPVWILLCFQQPQLNYLTSALCIGVAITMQLWDYYHNHSSALSIDNSQANFTDLSRKYTLVGLLTTAAIPLGSQLIMAKPVTTARIIHSIYVSAATGAAAFCASSVGRIIEP